MLSSFADQLAWGEGMVPREWWGKHKQVCSSICGSGGHACALLAQMEHASLLLTQVGMRAHTLAHHFHGPFPKGSRPGNGPQPRAWRLLS